jgi:hypothetical protein
MRSRGQHEEFRPIGTITILLLYVLIIIVLWGSVYLTLLSRGVTQ